MAISKCRCFLSYWQRTITLAQTLDPDGNCKLNSENLLSEKVSLKGRKKKNTGSLQSNIFMEKCLRLSDKNRNWLKDAVRVKSRCSTLALHCYCKETCKSFSKRGEPKNSPGLLYTRCTVNKIQCPAQRGSRGVPGTLRSFAWGGSLNASWSPGSIAKLDRCHQSHVHTRHPLPATNNHSLLPAELIWKHSAWGQPAD